MFFRFLQSLSLLAQTDRKQNNHVDKTQKDVLSVEQEMVSSITTKDMLQFNMMPYDLNCVVHHYISDKGHPFAYINLSHSNQLVATEELMQINEFIIQAYDYIPSIRYAACLHTNKIAFSEYSKNYGYTRLICTPYTKTGKISKAPLSLDFMTRLDKDDYRANGTLFYGLDGSVFKADVHIFKNVNKKDFEGWSFYFKMVGRSFVLYEAKEFFKTDKKMHTIYKFET